MKFSSDKSALQQALQQLGKVTPVRSTLPILSSVLITADEADKKRLQIRATDLEISQIVYIPSKVEKEGSVAVQHRTLLDISSEMPEGELEIEVSEEGKVHIKTSYGDYSLMSKPIDEFPSLPDVDSVQQVKIPAHILKRVIEKTSFATSKDELKPSLMGVLFQFHEDSFRAIATDGHRLVKHIRKDFSGERYKGENIVPVKFLNILVSYMTDDEMIDLNIGENHVMMESSETTIYTRIIDERFPDYESVFPQDNDKKLKVNRQKLLAAVRRVSIFSNKTTHQIALRMGEEGIEITTEDVETVSTARESLECDYNGEPLVIGYNSNYVRDLISHLDSEEIIMEFRSPVTATVIYPDKQEDNEDLQMLLMPIRLND